MANDTFYVDDGYVADGYIANPRLVILNYGATRLDLRGPSSRSGSVQVIQAQEYSSGWARFGYAPIAAVHTLNLDYTRMDSTDRAALESFWGSVDATVRQFSYTDGAALQTNAVWFDTPELVVEESYLNTFKTTLSMISLTSFFQLSGTPPTINSADTILSRLFNPTGHNRQKQQPRIMMSNGTFRSYNKSSITRAPRSITMLRRTRAELAAVIYFLVTVCQGIRYTFPWTFDGSAKTVRFSEPRLDWRQSSVNTALFDVTVTLEEDA